eukprot:559705-Amphidinium_carterae.1
MDIATLQDNLAAIQAASCSGIARPPRPSALGSRSSQDCDKLANTSNYLQTLSKSFPLPPRGVLFCMDCGSWSESAYQFKEKFVLDAPA